MQCTIRLNSVVKYVIDDANIQCDHASDVSSRGAGDTQQTSPHPPPDPYNGSVLCPSLVNRMNSNQSYNVAGLSADVLIAGGNVAL